MFTLISQWTFKKITDNFDAQYQYLAAFKQTFIMPCRFFNILKSSISAELVKFVKFASAEKDSKHVLVHKFQSYIKYSVLFSCYLINLKRQKISFLNNKSIYRFITKLKA